MERFHIHMNFVNDLQRRAVFASMFSRQPSVSTNVFSVKTDINALMGRVRKKMRDDVDIQEFDPEAHYDSHQSMEWNYKNFLRILDKMGFLKEEEIKPSEASAQAANSLVGEMAANRELSLDDINVRLSGDRATTLKFRTELMRAIVGHVIDRDDPRVVEFAGKDHTFNRYLYDYDKAQHIPTTSKLVDVARKIRKNEALIGGDEKKEKRLSDKIGKALDAIERQPYVEGSEVYMDDEYEIIVPTYEYIVK